MLDQVKTIKMDKETKRKFEQMVDEIDPLLSSSMAILKLMRYAIEQHWLPGYIQKGSSNNETNMLKSERYDPQPQANAVKEKEKKNEHV